MEKALLIPIDSDMIVGVLHGSEQVAETGVLLVVGGPQTRVGSHRQFVLLARSLAGQGIPVLRFDYRGMGDSTGDQYNFEQIDADIRVAIERFFEESPQMEKVVIWGLCDAASAALFYAHQDERVQGLVLLNPWARSEAGAAKAYLKHYYLKRVVSGDFWKKVLGGQFKPGQSLSSLFEMLKKGMGLNSSDSVPVNAEAKVGEFDKGTVVSDASEGASEDTLEKAQPFIERMRDGLERFQHPVLLIISGNDLTASEFLDCVASDRRWRKLLKRKQVIRKTLEAADHTFSKRQWRDQVADWTADWVLKLK